MSDDVAGWVRSALSSAIPYAPTEAAVARADELIAGLPDDGTPRTTAVRALVLDVRARLLATLRTDRAPVDVHADAVEAARLFDRCGLWHLAASSYVQAAAMHVRAGAVSTCLDLVVRGVLTWQLGATRPDDGDAPSLVGLAPELAGLEDWAGPVATQARIDNQLGIVAYELHAYDQAALFYREGIEASAAPGGGPQTVFLLHNLSESLLLRATLPDDRLDPQQRRVLLTEALRAARAVAEGGHGVAWEGVDGPRLVADVLCHLGRAADAWTVLTAVESRYGRDPVEGQGPTLRLVRGRVLRALGRPIEATVELDSAVTDLDKAASRVEGDFARLERSLAFQDAGDLEAAWQDAAAVAASVWGRHRSHVRGLFDLVWTRAGIEGERRHLEALAETLARVALSDPLTGLLNRRGLEQALGDVDPLADVGVLVVDVDYFKTVNDRFGHDVGDDVLRRIAECLQEQCQGPDGGTSGLLARWGGEEFVVVVHPPPGRVVGAGVEREALLALGERLRAAVAGLDHGDGGPRTTLSVGVGLGRARWWREVLQVADEAMFRAKRSGRDRVVGA